MPDGGSISDRLECEWMISDGKESFFQKYAIWIIGAVGGLAVVVCLGVFLGFKPSGEKEL
jgi:hypothetical protein